MSRTPVIAPDELRTRAEHERALLILSILANAWVWGGSEPDLTLPHQISRPLCAVAHLLDRPPIVHYASMALNNWRKIDPTGPVNADNTRMQIQFLGGVDEDWFFMVSIEVEIAGAPLLTEVHAAVAASRCDDDEGLTRHLDAIANGMGAVLEALERMREWCDPHVFYHRVRPYLTGWPEPGVVYDGVSDTPKIYVGGSAAQSSLIQVLDALLGVAHASAGRYLQMVRSYMPPEHRQFVLDVERLAMVRQRAEAGAPALREAYNAVVEAVDAFRRRHIALAHDYIVKPSRMALDGKGTGGTDFVDFLREARIATARSRIGAK